MEISLIVSILWYNKGKHLRQLAALSSGIMIDNVNSDLLIKSAQVHWNEILRPQMILPYSISS